MASGTTTREYCTISRQLSTVVNNLSETVDPGNFAQKLLEANLVTRHVMQRANVVGFLTPAERIRPIISAVLAQIELRASTYHQFLSILKDTNSLLADTLSSFFTTDLELNVVSDLSELSNWQGLGHQLNIDPVKLKLLNELQRSGRDSERCKEDLLMYWVTSDPSATWKVLARALDQMKEHDLSLEITKKYITCALDQSKLQWTIYHYDVMGGKGTDEPDVESDMESGDNPDSQCQADEFESWFEELSFQAQAEIEEKHTSLKRFRSFLTLLPESIRIEHYQFLYDSLSDIMNAGSIERVFGYLNLYWNFFDYNLLEHIIKKFGSVHLKKEMRMYVQALSHFRKVTTLQQFIERWQGLRAEPPPNFSEVTMQLTKKAAEYTLEELEQLRQRTCKECRFKPFVLMLAKAEEGSLTIVWHLPSVLVPEFKLALCGMRCFFEEHKITRLEVDGVCIFSKQPYSHKEGSTGTEMDDEMFGSISSTSRPELETSLNYTRLSSTASEYEVFSGASVLSLQSQIDSKLDEPLQDEREHANPQYEWTLLIAISGYGKTIKVGCNQEDKISKIKTRIERSEGIPIAQQVLMSHPSDTEAQHDRVSNEMQNSGTVTSYGIRNGDKLLLSFALQPLTDDDYGKVFVKSSLTDKKLAISVKGTDSVAHFKSKLQRLTGIPPENQQLIYNGSEMINEAGSEPLLLKDYDVRNADTIHLIPRIKPRSTIFVKTVGRDTITLDYRPEDEIGNLKAMIHLEAGIPLDQQCLIFAGRPLDDRQTLQECKVESGATIYLAVAYKPGRSMLLSVRGEGRVFVKGPHSRPFPLDVKSSDTVANIKAKIHKNFEEIPPEGQRLIFAGKELKDNDVIANHSIRDGDTLHLLFTAKLSSKHPREKEEVGPRLLSECPDKRGKITIRTPAGEQIDFSVEASETIAHIKTRLQEKEGVPAECQELRFAGTVLRNHHTLSQCGVQNESTIYLLTNQIFVRVVTTIVAESMKLYYSPRYLIADIKAMIQEKTAIPSERQIVIFGYKVLEDDKSASEYNIQNGSTVYVTSEELEEVELEEQTLFYVKLLSSKKTIVLNYEPSVTVKTIKLHVRDMEDINPEDQTLLYEETVLEDNQTIGYYNIPRQGVIELKVKERDISA